MKSDVVIIGAGAAGLFAASKIASSGKKVVILDNGKKVGRKILIAGGGFCNFTNLDIQAANYLSSNPNFVKSALARYTQWDFIALLQQYKVQYHEKELGQLFTDHGANKIVDVLLAECNKYQVQINLRQSVDSVQQQADDSFLIKTNNTEFTCQQLIIATGGLALKELGATPFGYQIANQFGINVIPISAGLVPLTWQDTDKKIYAELAGVTLNAIVSTNTQSFQHNILFTHRGLSGPAILQISNYWQLAEPIYINFLPTINIVEHIQQARLSKGNTLLTTVLAQLLPKKLVDVWSAQGLVTRQPIAELTKQQLIKLATLIHAWQFMPNGTEGYRSAEVTRGGVDTRELSSKTMQANKVKNLFFIGEVVDVTGWLGGYNLQWAWSSANACAEYISNL